MSATIESGESGVEFETSEAVTRRFKVTDENRSKQITAHVNADVQSYIENTVLKSAQWRSFSQFVNDALTFYLDGAGDAPSVDHIRQNARRSSDHSFSAAVTPTLYYEVEMLCKHQHTPWESKQEFYTCALFSYIDAGNPVIDRR